MCDDDNKGNFTLVLKISTVILVILLSCNLYLSFVNFRDAIYIVEEKKELERHIMHLKLVYDNLIDQYKISIDVMNELKSIINLESKDIDKRLCNIQELLNNIGNIKAPVKTIGVGGY